jgi:gluconolactonase
VDRKSGAVATVITDMVRPNGSLSRPTRNTSMSLTRGDAQREADTRWTRNGAELSGGKIFAESTSGLFDGFRVDRNGLFGRAGRGVHCYEVDGTLIGKILIPEIVANVTFGGAKLNRLFICGTTSLYSMYVTANDSKLG